MLFFSSSMALVKKLGPLKLQFYPSMKVKKKEVKIQAVYVYKMLCNCQVFPLLWLLFLAGLPPGVHIILAWILRTPSKHAEVSPHWVPSESSESPLPCPSAGQYGAKESVQLSPCHQLAWTLHFIASELQLEIPWQGFHQHRLVCFSVPSVLGHHAVPGDKEL